MSSDDKETLQGQAPTPLTSIGMPVYNEAEFVQQSLQSVLAQDYPNLEIIISDNGSTDSTSTLCRKLIENDKRVRFHQFAENAGVNANFHYVFQHANGKYFLWASGHDIWTPDLIAKCVATLEANPTASLAFGTNTWIDRDEQILDRQTGWTDTRGLGAIGRFMTVFWGNMNPILGVIRVASMPDLSKAYTRAGADLTLLLELVLSGDFIHVPDANWSRRDIRNNEKYDDKLKRFGSKEFGIHQSFMSKLFPLIGLPTEIIRVLSRSKVSWGAKLAILLMLLPALPVRYFMGKKGNQ